ncbi:MAG TPA: transcription antitermination factor NusB [Bacteroidetes bacterium]|nr:transcription antitermination factor NusB [Bacteroidota bacterium]
MYSRRLLRIKVMQVLYAYLKTESPSLSHSEKELLHSIKKSYDLYHYLLLLVIEVKNYALERIELARNKKRPTYQDLHPNTRFVDNRIILQLEESTELRKYTEYTGISWVQYPELIRKLYRDMLDKDWYRKYMDGDEPDYAIDRELIVHFYHDLVLGSDELSGDLEEQSIYWNDELEFVVGMIIKTIQKFRAAQGGNVRLMAMYKSPDDAEFTKRLFRRCLVHYDEYLKLIETYSHNWDIERIAYMDNLLMVMAITEITEFPEIPVRVTFDEYIEIAKYYSTERSSHFINGVLDKIIHHLREEKKIIKKGRGLIGEV